MMIDTSIFYFRHSGCNLKVVRLLGHVVDTSFDQDIDSISSPIYHTSKFSFCNCIAFQLTFIQSELFLCFYSLDNFQKSLQAIPHFRSSFCTICASPIDNPFLN
jgi:hypothetical protein